MNEIDELFDEIRLWNRSWNVYNAYKYSSIRYPNEEVPEKPDDATGFIIRLGKKYIVNKK